jgi:hypothetical protein
VCSCVNVPWCNQQRPASQPTATRQTSIRQSEDLPRGAHYRITHWPPAKGCKDLPRTDSGVHEDVSDVTADSVAQASPHGIHILCVLNSRAPQTELNTFEQPRPFRPNGRELAHLPTKPTMPSTRQVHPPAPPRPALPPPHPHALSRTR